MKPTLFFITLLYASISLAQSVNYNPRNESKSRQNQSEERKDNAAYESLKLIVVRDTTNNDKISYNKTLDSIRVTYNLKKIELKQKRDDALSASIDRTTVINAYREGLRKAYTEAGLQYDHAFAFKSNIFPVRNRLLARIYYSGNIDPTIDALKNNSFTISEQFNSGSIYSELIAGYAVVFRIGLGAMVAKSDFKTISSEDVQNLDDQMLDDLRKSVDSINAANLTAQNILGGGGNLLLNFATPILEFSTDLEDLAFKIFFFERIGFSVPELGTISTDPEFINQVGLQADFWWDWNFLGDRSFAVGCSGIFNIISNDQYSKSLGIESGSSTFSIAEITPSIEIDGRFRIFARIPFLLSESPANPFTFSTGVSIIPFN